MKCCWFDWAYFEWGVFEQPLPARIMMIINLTDTITAYDIYQNPNSENSEHYHTSITHVSIEKWVIVLN